MRKSDESAYSIVPSRASSRISSIAEKDRRMSTGSSELIYQELSVDNDLFTARVYKRNYRNAVMHFNTKTQMWRLPIFSDQDALTTRNRIDNDISDTQSSLSYQTTIKQAELPERLSSFAENNSASRPFPSAFNSYAAASEKRVWVARVRFLLSGGKATEARIEGPSAWVTQRLAVQESSSTPWPSVGEFVASSTPNALKRVLDITSARFNDWKMCFLYEASQQGKTQLVKVLLDRGVYVHSPTARGNAELLHQTTPLHVAAYSNRFEVVRMFLQRKDYLNLAYSQPQGVPRDDIVSGQSWLHRYPFHRMAHCCDNYGRQPLHNACQVVSLPIIKALVEAGAPINWADSEAHQPLHIAVKSHTKALDTIDFLLSNGADVEAQTLEGDTPLHLACINNSLDMVGKILGRKPPLDAEDMHGFTPLHLACRYGNLKLIRKLLRAGSSVNARSKEGFTPLYVACIRGVLAPVGELLERGAQANDEDSWAQSPLVVAVSGFNFPIVIELLTGVSNVNFVCGITGRTILQHVLSEQCFDTISHDHRRRTIQVLLANGAKANSQDFNGNNVLHHWAMVGVAPSDPDGSQYYSRLEEDRLQPLLAVLVKTGAEIDAKNDKGESPLYLARRAQNDSLAEVLLAAGAQELTFLEKRSLQKNGPDLASIYYAGYPRLTNKSFTPWKSGSVPRLLVYRHICAVELHSTTGPDLSCAKCLQISANLQPLHTTP